MSEPQHSYEFRLVTESVAKEDKFADKTHEKSADLLYQLITKTPYAVTIGLEGGWGSGKSTVVHFLKEKLKNESVEKYHTFTFDAWAHDADPLRRIFLERLIESVKPINQIDEFLEERKERVVLKKKTVKSKSKKTVTKLGKRLSFSILLLPLATFLITLSSKINVSDWINYGLLGLGGLIAALPVFVLWYWWCFSERNDQGKVRFDIFESDTTEEVDQDVTEDSERTSVEFERYFDEIIRHSLEAKYFDKLVIVIDNLDRIESEQAKHVWSTLQTFFQHRSFADGKSQWTNNVWFVIPYDREGLEHIWKKDEKNASDAVVAKSFMDKSIQLTVEVPNPVMSLWVNYAKEQIAFAFDSWCKEKRDDVERRFISFFGSFKQSPTPREINNAINQIGVLGIKYGDSMSASAMALYALCKQSVTSKQLRDLLLDKDESGDSTNAVIRAISSASIDTKYQLAGMLFGVDRNRGAELLIEPEIKDAFNNGDASGFQSIVNSYKEAFQIAWEANIKSWLPNSVLDDYALNFVKVVSSVENWGALIDNERADYLFSNLSNFIQQSVQKSDFEKYDHSVLISNLSSLLRGELKEQTLIVISDRVHKELGIVIASMSTDVKVNDQLIVNVHKSRQRLTESGLSAKRLHYTKLDSESWPKWVESIKKLSLDFECVLPNKDVLTEIVESVGFNSPVLDENRMIGFYHAVKLRSFQITVEIASKIVQWGKQLNRKTNVEHNLEGGIEAYYKTLVYLLKDNNPSLKKEILEMLSLEEFWSAIKECEGVPTLRLLSAVALNQKEDIALPDCVLSDYWKDELESNEMTSIIEDLVSLNALGSVWLLAQDSENKLAIQIIRTNDKRIYESKFGIRYLDEYHWMNDEHVKSITEALCAGGSFEANKAHMIGKDRIDSYYDVFKILMKNGSSEAKDFIQEQIANLSKEDWIDFLKQDKKFYDLLTGKSLSLTYAFFDLLQEYIQDSSGLFPIDVANLDNLLEKVTDVKNGRFNPIALTYLEIRGADTIPTELFNKLKPVLAQAINDARSQSIMYRISNWLAEEKYDRVNWLLDSGFKATERVLEGLKQQIVDGLKRADDNIELYRKLAGVFDVSPEIKQEELNERI